jgi:hypothetical protein
MIFLSNQFKRLPQQTAGRRNACIIFSHTAILMGTAEGRVEKSEVMTILAFNPQRRTEGEVGGAKEMVKEGVPDNPSR